MLDPARKSPDSLGWKLISFRLPSDLSFRVPLHGSTDTLRLQLSLVRSRASVGLMVGQPTHADSFRGLSHSRLEREYLGT